MVGVSITMFFSTYRSIYHPTAEAAAPLLQKEGSFASHGQYLGNPKLASEPGRIESYMTNNLMLRNTSLLLLLLLTLHVVDDVIHGFDSAGLVNMIGIVVLGFLIYGTLVLHERMSGHIVMLFIALFSALMPIVHLRSPRINETVQASGGFFFIWTLWALGSIGIFGIILATQGLLSLRRNKRGVSEDA